MTPAERVALLGALTLLAACGEGEAAGGYEGWRAVRDTVGDTAVVHTVAGSVWGGERRLVEEVRIGRLEGPEELTFGQIRGLAVGPEGVVYVVDVQAPALRKYAPDGGYLGTFGAEGGGPGEYGGPDGAVAVLSDGRVLLRDPANGRLNVYGPGGEFLDEWRVRGGMYTTTPLYVDTADHVYNVHFDFTEDGTRRALMRFGPDGTVLDTLPVPELGHEMPLLEASVEADGRRRMARRPVPFTPGEFWTLSPGGYFVTAVGSRYAIDLRRREAPVLRVGRDRPPAPVKPEEKANARERTVAAMRQVDPGWDWNGPTIPETKPPFRGLLADAAGRVWVLLHAEAEPIPEEEIDETRGPNAMPPARWREPVVYDVFEPDGRFLGSVRAPAGFQVSPPPVIEGDRVWALVEDELGVQYVVRYRIAGAEIGR